MGELGFLGTMVIDYSTPGTRGRAATGSGHLKGVWTLRPHLWFYNKWMGVMLTSDVVRDARITIVFDKRIVPTKY